MTRILLIIFILFFGAEANDFRKGMLFYNKGDYNQAAAFFKSSIQENKSVTSHYILGKMYMLGKGVEKSQQKAVPLLEYALEKGNIPAGCYLAEAYILLKIKLDKVESALEAGLKRNIPYCEKVHEKYLKLSASK